MIKNNVLVLILFLLTQMIIGQVGLGKEIHGKISVDSLVVDRVNVVNSANGKATVSDKNGFFFIFVKEGDILVFSAVNLVTLRKEVAKDDLKAGVISVQMTPKSIALKEVVVNEYPQITAENLGIIPYGQKKYSSAERKLYTATSGDGIDGLLNAISGRKAMLKKEIGIEKKEQALARLDILFEEKYYLENLKIPLDYLRGFQYYCVEDTGFVSSLKAKNKTLTMFLIVGLAEKYKQIIENEK
jgi:hypothetical protein